MAILMAGSFTSGFWCGLGVICAVLSVAVIVLILVAIAVQGE